jgi:hypothetical protein
MKFGNEFWLILFQEYINPKLFAVFLLRQLLGSKPDISQHIQNVRRKQRHGQHTLFRQKIYKK